MKALSLLPDDALAHLLSWFTQVGAHGAWPEWFRLNLMAILGKATGGVRTVAKTLMVYRAWCGIHKTVAAEWETPLPRWDACRPGTSALGAALLRAPRAERAALTGESIAT